MKTKSIDSELLLTCLKDKKIMTIDDLKSTLRTQCRMTVFINLSMLGYISSYSHSGRYGRISEVYMPCVPANTQIGRSIRK